MRAPSWRYKGMSRAMARKLSVYDGYTSPPRSARGRRRKYKARGYTRGFKVYSRDAEVKHLTYNRSFDLSVSTDISGIGVQFAMDTAGVNTTSLTNMSQGNDAETRIGNSVTGKWIEIAGEVIGCSLTKAGADLGTDGDEIATGQRSRTIFRVIAFRDKQWNSTEIAIPNLYDTVLAPTYPSTNAMLKIGNLGRFEIMAQKWITTDTTDPTKTFRFRINMRNTKMRYNGGGGQSVLQSNRIHLVTVAYTPLASAVVVQTVPQVSYCSRFAFTDA